MAFKFTWSEPTRKNTDSRNVTSVESTKHTTEEGTIELVKQVLNEWKDHDVTVQVTVKE